MFETVRGLSRDGGVVKEGQSLFLAWSRPSYKMASAITLSDEITNCSNDPGSTGRSSTQCEARSEQDSR
jgi:hypothetical protein